MGAVLQVDIRLTQFLSDFLSFLTPLRFVNATLFMTRTMVFASHNFANVIRQMHTLPRRLSRLRGLCIEANITLNLNPLVLITSCRVRSTDVYGFCN